MTTALPAQTDTFRADILAGLRRPQNRVYLSLFPCCTLKKSAEITMKATWNGAVLAESDRTVVIEGNHYFPPDAIHKEYFRPSLTRTVCGWKGTAHYYTIEVGDKQNPDAAWYYPDPKEAAKEIADHVAFWKGVTVEG